NHHAQPSVCCAALSHPGGISMQDRKLRVITSTERPWATGKRVIFLGKFELDDESGLYFQQFTDDKHRSAIVAAFARMPAQLRQVAVAAGLTLSTSGWAKTLERNSSTFYSGFSQERNTPPTSPHIEFGDESLTDELLLAHFTHELSHLFWASLPAQKREA